MIWIKKQIDVTKPYYSNRYGKFVTEGNAHGRNEFRECFVYSCPALTDMLEGWKGVKSVVRILSRRTSKPREKQLLAADITSHL